MKSLSETLYLKSPVFLQNLNLSLYGFKIQRVRYGREYKDYFNSVIARWQYSEHELSRYINFVLRKTIKEAVENVPYYRELFQAHSIAAKDIQSIEDIEKIPFLEKDCLRKNARKFINEKYNTKDLLCIHTTGTTGTPLKIFCNEQVRRLNYAYYNRFLEKNSIKHKGKRATFGGRIVVPPEQEKPPFWRYSYFQKNLLFSSYHLTERNMPFYIDELRRFGPDFIDAYPSSLFMIAAYAEKHGVDLKGITNGISTSAETLFSSQREVIESTFGVPVFDQYGAAEMCVFVGQCKEGNYHIHSDYAVLEFLREDGAAAKPGEEAELVCTSFINPLMPLIRYRIGDQGVLSEETCKCGIAFPVVEKILGRMDDVILTPDGRRVGRLSPVFKGFPVKEVQYVQRNTTSVEVFIVRDGGFSKATEKNVIEELRKRLGYQILIKVKYVDHILCGPGSKLRSIISHVH